MTRVIVASPLYGTLQATSGGTGDVVLVRSAPSDPRPGPIRTLCYRSRRALTVSFGRDTPPTGEAGDHFHFRERVGHRRMPRFIPRPSRLAPVSGRNEVHSTDAQ